MAGENYRREREEKAVSITSIILHKHYCENDVEAVIGYFDEPFMWIGAGEISSVLSAVWFHAATCLKKNTVHACWTMTSQW